MVNKKEYEESEIYKEIKIIIPRSREELEKDFEYCPYCGEKIK